jgi:hypothetical protein
LGVIKGRYLHEADRCIYRVEFIPHNHTDPADL